MLENTRVILVQTSHPGNIGSVARAMKTMGLSKLYLVNPNLLPNHESEALASGAIDVLQQAVIVEQLAEAIAECRLVVGLSARARGVQWPLMTPRQCAELLFKEGTAHPVALVFGCERSGLSNQALQQCHYQVMIPTHPAYSSLNLAMAVQIVVYEIYTQWQQQQVLQPEQAKIDYPSVTDLAHLYHHLQRVLEITGFMRTGYSGQVMEKLKRLFSRARLETAELKILRGILTAVEQLQRATKSASQRSSRG